MKNLKAYKIKKLWQKTDFFLPRGILFKQKEQDFCTKMKFPPLFMISWGTGARQDYFVSFFCWLSPQARGTSVMSSLFHSVLKGIHGDIRKELRLSRLFFCFNLHRPGVHQWSLQCLKVSAKECVINSVQLEGKVWYLTQLSSQARDTSIESFLFQSVCNFSSC